MSYHRPSLPDGWIIDEMDVLLVPTAAHCQRCNLPWERPESDHWADTLEMLGAHHACQERG